MTEKLKTFLIPLTILFASLVIAGALFFGNRRETQGPASESTGILSSQQVAQMAIDYINQNLLTQGLIASLMDVKEENGVYKIHLKIGEEEYDSYVTRDGKLLFPQGFSLISQPETSGEEVGQSLSQREKADVKLFVMSYCPFGLQAQKMFLPVYDLLKEKAEMGIYFVNYIMHEKQEIDENLRQYCIQKEEKEKYDNYLICFVEDGNFENCLSEAKIDRGRLTACISATDQEYNISSQYNDQNTWLNGSYPRFDVHKALNEEYGVGGSPTVVVNDQVVSVSPRSPENFKNIICQAFSSPPEECSQILSNDTPSSGFGLGAGSGNGGACQ